MKEIHITRGATTLVDDEDYETLNKYKWYRIIGYGNHQYSARYLKTHSSRKQSRELIYMHRVIMGNPPMNKDIDHMDGNGLNNQKNNLRVATRSQNQANRGKPKNNTSGYKGVVIERRKCRRKYLAIIKIDGRTKYLGCFYSAKEAGIAYNKAAINIFGEFAKLNEVN
jgi:hypothetical protein